MVSSIKYRLPNPPCKQREFTGVKGPYGAKLTCSNKKTKFQRARKVLVLSRLYSPNCTSPNHLADVTPVYSCVSNSPSYTWEYTANTAIGLWARGCPAGFWGWPRVTLHSTP